MPSKRDLVDFWKKSGLLKDKNALAAFMAVERKHFMVKGTDAYAYEDVALPIICGQTISQPSTVMMMTQALELKKGMKVLEIGSGSGYQAAIIAKVIGAKGKLYTTEIIPELADFAKTNLEKEHIANVEVIHSDGSEGYKEKAPYDRIIVTAAAPLIPKPLIEQLKVNGIMVIPVGSGVQKLIKVVKHKNSVDKADLGYFRFVPLRGKHGMPE
ncbi:MAG: protein-L-isoaspartate(D-aspartate) O-methyltransferase [Nanoarchaeota archaeon]|nr:protein-L-isoaspartate(D-aspartate) O-methyltransferase [Nanoarchaeota archaeon]